MISARLRVTYVHLSMAMKESTTAEQRRIAVPLSAQNARNYADSLMVILMAITTVATNIYAKQSAMIQNA
jgi:hypothetical protein